MAVNASGRQFNWSIEDRLRRHVEVYGDCWIWTGSTTRNGYGQMAVGGVRWMSHRRTYSVLVGPIPEGLDLDHLCRVRACVNPDHLEPVTRSENLSRGVPRGEHLRARTHCPQGHPYDEQNTAHRRGRRCCRACEQARAKQAREARRGTH